MRIPVSKNGMVKKEIALASGLPIYDLTIGEPTERTFDDSTRNELSLLNITLDDFEREHFIVGFLKDKNYRGYLPLYSLQIMLHRKF